MLSQRATSGLQFGHRLFQLLFFILGGAFETRCPCTERLVGSIVTSKCE